METNATRLCALLVGLPDVNVLAVDGRHPAVPLGAHVETRSEVDGRAGRTVAEVADGMGDESMPDDVRPLVGTLARWRGQILVWHTARVTNGLAETLNNLTKRAGFAIRNFARQRRQRIRVLFNPGKPNWSLLATVTPR